MPIFSFLISLFFFSNTFDCVKRGLQGSDIVVINMAATCICCRFFIYHLES